MKSLPGMDNLGKTTMMKCLLPSLCRKNNDKLKTLNPNCVHTTSTLVHFLNPHQFYSQHNFLKNPLAPTRKKRRGSPFTP